MTNPIFKDKKKPLILLLAALLAGILGRMGGAKGYNTKFRDLGVAFIFTGLMVWFTRGSFNLWLLLAHLVAFLALFGALTTYWDNLFGWDNMWFAGFVTGLAAFPYSIISRHWIGFGARAFLLAIIWGLLNKFLPKKILFLQRVIVEEFSRYFFVILTIPLLTW